MILSDLISDVGTELDRSDLDTQIKRWIQQSVDFVFNTLQTKGSEESVSLTATASTETIALPGDFGTLIDLRYIAGDDSGYQLVPLSPNEFFRRYADQTQTGYPTHFCIFDDYIHLSPLPSSTYSYTLTYHVSSANVYEHSINFTDADGAATTGVLIYIDEDAVRTGVGKLYFVSPTSADAKIRLASLDGHQHDVTIYHSASAATLGVAWYFDEDGGTSYERNLFVSPTGKDCVIKTDSFRDHAHYIKFIDSSSAASTGVGVYCDEDAAVKTQRLLFVSPTDANGTSQVVLSPNYSLPPFIERYHEVIFLGALARGLRFSKKYQEAGMLNKEVEKILASITTGEAKRRPVVQPATPFSSSSASAWDSLKYPEIDD